MNCFIKNKKEVLRESGGTFTFDINKSNKASQAMLDQLDGKVSFPKISAISEEKYLDVYGYLFINYLVQEHSMEKFMEMLVDLKNYPYIDKRIAHKTEQMEEILLKTIEKHYGSLEQLSEGYKNFYDNSTK